MSRGPTFSDRLKDAILAESPEYVGSESKDMADVDLSRGEARFNWPADVLAALTAPRSRQMHYQDPMGSLDLRTAFLAAAVPERIRGLDAGNVLVTSGGKQALWLAFLTMVGSGDRVLLPRPGWAPYAIWTRTCRAEASWYDPRDPGAEAVIRQVASGAFDHVVVNSPNNPTGVEYGQEVMDAIAAAAAKAGVGIISDEVYRGFASKGATFLPHVDPEGSRIVVADSLSKSAGAAGLRLGFLVGGWPTIKSAVAIRGTVDSCPPGIGQSAGTFLLSPALRRFRDGIRKLAGTSVSRLVELLKAEDMRVESSGALYVWIPSDSVGGRIELGSGCVLRGTAGGAFGQSGYVRLCPVTDDSRVAALLNMEVSMPGLAE